jgi:molybdopterin converting factor small subunit
MLLRVKLFGPLKCAVGQAEIAVEIDDSCATCVELRRCLSTCQPRLGPWLPGCRFAVNRQFAQEEQPLSDRDEIALVGFVSGG